MYKKMLIVIGAITLILTGCTKISDNLDDIKNDEQNIIEIKNEI